MGRRVARHAVGSGDQELVGGELAVERAGVQQLLVRADGDDPAAVEDHDLVAVDDRAQPVRHDDQRALRRRRRRSPRAGPPRCGRRGCWSARRAAGSARRPAACGRSPAAAARRRRAARRPRRPARPGPRGAGGQRAQVDLVERGEQPGVVGVRARSAAGCRAACRPAPAPPARRSRAARRSASRGRSRTSAPSTRIGAGGDLVEALDQREHGRLAGAGRPDQRDPAAARHGERHVPQHRLARPGTPKVTRSNSTATGAPPVSDAAAAAGRGRCRRPSRRAGPGSPRSAAARPARSAAGCTRSAPGPAAAPGRTGTGRTPPGRRR